MSETKYNPEQKWNEISSKYGRKTREYIGFPFTFLSRFKNIKFLEAGSGDGEIAIFMATIQNCDVVGLEIADNFLEMSRKKIKERNVSNIEFIKGDVRKMPFENESFDLIFSGGVIEHFDETFEALAEHVRILKVNGYLLIGVPCKEGLHYPLKILMQKLSIWEVGFEKSFTKKEFMSKLNSQNLEIVDKHYIPIRPSNNQSNLRKILTYPFSILDVLIGGVHMQYYLCKKIA